MKLAGNFNLQLIRCHEYPHALWEIGFVKLSDLQKFTDFGSTR